MTGYLTLGLAFGVIVRTNGYEWYWAFLMALLPLSVCCMYLIMSQESIHTLVMYGFVTLYMLRAALLERQSFSFSRHLSDIAALLLAGVVLIA